MNFSNQFHVAVLMPLRDDWTSARELIRRLDEAIARAFPCRVDIVLVDDASLERCPAEDFQHAFSVVRSIRVLRLRRNLSHQRAIALGMAFLYSASPADAVMVMDADGEDSPEGAVRLLQAFRERGGATAVFAERRRRSESLLFRLLYFLYRTLHWVLTGIKVKVGNFSILPFSYLDTLVVHSDMWNHYAACVIRSGLPMNTIPLNRGTRIAGKSRMNFVSLVTHGLSAISVYAEIMAARVLIASLIGFGAVAIAYLGLVCARLFTDRAIPGWAGPASGLLAIVMIQFFTMGATLTFLTLASRAGVGFIPLRDYTLFIAETIEVYSSSESRTQRAPSPG